MPPCLKLPLFDNPIPVASELVTTNAPPDFFNASYIFTAFSGVIISNEPSDSNSFQETFAG